MVPENLCRIADLYLDDGFAPQAQAALSDAAALMDSSGQIYWEPELHRLRARLASVSSPGDPRPAIAEYERAVAIAHERKMRLLELRAATGLARLLAQGGDRARAVTVLAPVYEWFSGGFDKPDLVEAKQLLDALA